MFTVQQEIGMLLLMLGSTLQSGNDLEGGGLEPSNKKGNASCFLAKGERVEAIFLLDNIQPEIGMLLLMPGSTLEPGNNLEVEGWIKQ